MRLLDKFRSLFQSQEQSFIPEICGTWKSDKELSMEYNLKEPFFSPSQKELLEQILGVLTISYTNELAIKHAEKTLNIKMNGKLQEFYFEENIYRYEIVSIIKNVVTIKEFYPHGQPNLSYIYFKDENTYWVIPKVMPHTREYFRRVK